MFKADVTITGSVEAGDMRITIEQRAESRWQPPSWLITDTERRDVPRMNKPGYLQPAKDPTFKTTLIRVTGDPGTEIRNVPGARWGDEPRHHYNSVQAWNCDQSMMFLINGGAGMVGPSGVFIHGETYQPLFTQTGRPSSSDIKWHPFEPDLMFFARRSEIGVWNPKTGAVEVIQNLGASYADLLIGPWKGDFSADGSMVVITGKRGGSPMAFAYNIKTNEKHPDVIASGVNTASFSSARISPKGTNILWSFSPDIHEVTDLTGKKILTLPANYSSHGDCMLDHNGDEILVGRVNSSGVGQGPSGRISKYNMRDGKRTELTTGGWVSHTSGRALRGWCVGDAFEDAKYPPYIGEMIMPAVDGSAVFRLCHHRNALKRDYASEPQPSHARDAGRIVFASSWGATNEPPRPVAAYVADFRK